MTALLVRNPFPAAIAAIPAVELALGVRASRRPVRMIVTSIAALCLVGAGAGYYFTRDEPVPLLPAVTGWLGAVSGLVNPHRAFRGPAGRRAAGHVLLPGGGG